MDLLFGMVPVHSQRNSTHSDDYGQHREHGARRVLAPQLHEAVEEALDGGREARPVVHTGRKAHRICLRRVRVDDRADNAQTCGGSQQQHAAQAV